MNNGNAPAGDLRASMIAAVEPIRENLAVLNRQIDQTESDLAALRKLRTEAERVLVALDPDFERPARKTGAKRKPKPTHGGRTLAAERMEQIEAWLRENVREDEAFSLPMLQRERGFDMVPRGSWSFMTEGLLARGAISLDSVRGPAGSKLYRLTPTA